LSSERASFINGSVIRIDGGQTVKIWLLWTFLI
jgi:hypothetical protein